MKRHRTLLISVVGAAPSLALLYLWISTGDSKYEPWTIALGLATGLALAMNEWWSPPNRPVLQSRLTLAPYEARTRGQNSAASLETTVTYCLSSTHCAKLVPNLPYLDEIRRGGHLRETTGLTLTLPVVSCDVINESSIPALIQKFIFHVEGSAPVKEAIPRFSGSWSKPFSIALLNSGTAPMLDVSLSIAISNVNGDRLLGPFRFEFPLVTQHQDIEMSAHFRAIGVDVDYLGNLAYLDRMSAQMDFAAEKDPDRKALIRSVSDQIWNEALGPLPADIQALPTQGEISYAYLDAHGRRHSNQVTFDCRVTIFGKPTAPPPLQCTYDVMLRESGRQYEIALNADHVIPGSSAHRFDFALAAPASSSHIVSLCVELHDGNRIWLQRGAYFELLVPTELATSLRTTFAESPPTPPPFVFRDEARRPVPTKRGKPIAGLRYKSPPRKS